MADKRVDRASQGSGIRNASRGQGSDRQKLDNAPGPNGETNAKGKRREDPVQEVMNSNPNPSPPIRPSPRPFSGQSAATRRTSRRAVSETPRAPPP